MQVQKLRKDGADYNCTWDDGERCNRVVFKGIDLASMRKFNEIELKHNSYTRIMRALCDEHISIVSNTLRED